MGVGIGLRTGVGGGAQPIGAPVQGVETIVRTAKGTATGVGTLLTKTGVSVAAGSYLFVVLGFVPNQEIDADASCVKLNGSAVFTAVEFPGTTQGRLDGVGITTVLLLYAYCASAISNGTLTVDFYENGQGSAEAPSCVMLTEVAGLASSAVLDKMACVMSQVASTTPSSGATAVTAQEHEFVFGIVGTNGPLADAPGTWVSPLSNGQRLEAVFEDVYAITISEGSYIQTAAAAQTAAKTGITASYWVAGCATFKAAA